MNQDKIIEDGNMIAASNKLFIRSLMAACVFMASAQALADGDDVIRIEAPRPSNPCGDRPNCGGGMPRERHPSPAQPAPRDGASGPSVAQLAETMRQVDVRCQAGMPDTTSQAEPNIRLAAAQGAFDAKGMRIGFLWDSVKRRLGGAGGRVTVTFADNGSETYNVINITGSIALAAQPGSLVQGSGVAEAANCNRG
ncbi:hypothetical protein FNU76_15805 [Chitinimonas arctica]|uniref:Uncharacterized protein n=1 Tax=Chitinimonas arctica TaxID=2594795 RepID=A0A516SHS1_9NEIS|nr:hypothetical protein [Chitinimonas arctica]QDQ27696.1 hypothetical protein FNU76_15805 [Chitinimonas arctica]